MPDNPEQSGSHFNRQQALKYGPADLTQGTWAVYDHKRQQYRDKLFRNKDIILSNETAIRLPDSLPSGDEEITPG